MGSCSAACGSTPTRPKGPRSCSTCWSKASCSVRSPCSTAARGRRVRRRWSRRTCLRIHRTHFLPYVKANPDLILAMLTLLCQRLRWTSSVIEDAAFLAFPARLAKRLLVLAEHYRRPHEHEVTVPLSQHDLGSMVGAGRETINKQLALWRSAGVLDSGHSAIA